ncbi:sigma-70 family RNA polymerase sigma factor, partial [Agromyces seonyuensis]
MAPRAAHERTDRDLLHRSRRGDRDAYAELWRRHATSGLTVARGLGAADPDDLVAEAFANIYRLVLDGKGPRESFRAYLFTTIRNLAAAAGRADRESPDDQLDERAHPDSEEAAVELGHDLRTAQAAFHALAPRWQEIIWYTEVEGMTPQQIAPRIGRSANTTAALAYRAREALRQAWIGAHIQPADDPDCRWTRERLGAWLREKLGVRDRTKVERHVDGCRMCALAVVEARAAVLRLDALTPPVALGLAVIGTAGAAAAAGAAGTLG